MAGHSENTDLRCLRINHGVKECLGSWEAQLVEESSPGTLAGDLDVIAANPFVPISEIATGPGCFVGVLLPPTQHQGTWGSGGNLQPGLGFSSQESQPPFPFPLVVPASPQSGTNLLLPSLAKLISTDRGQFLTFLFHLSSP